MTGFCISFPELQLFLDGGHDHVEHLVSILLLCVDSPSMSPESSQEEGRGQGGGGGGGRAEVVQLPQELQETSSDSASISF